MLHRKVLTVEIIYSQYRIFTIKRRGVYRIFSVSKAAFIEITFLKSLTLSTVIVNRL